ncbi:MAG: hypothetical protein L0387_38875 [Acidobacteria bacterium]|nr:hypothetical protein [Acidobacteriota bacterium]MCI0720798.1 hypothetical protein [Acidobacteriota bacterium]
MTRRATEIVVYLWTSMLMTASVFSEVPGSRPFYTMKSWNGVELIIVGISRLHIPDETKVVVDEHGAHLNTNQEFIYMSAARDFKDFTSTALKTPMMLRAETPRLPVPAGTRQLSTDGQNLSVTVTHQSDYSNLAIALDRHYNRAPRWIPTWWGGAAANPGSYPGYEREQPFCGRTLDAVLNELTGRVDAYHPAYYVVTYQGLAEVVVPLKFQRILSGRRLQGKPLGDLHGIMFGVSPKESSLGDPDEATDARVGEFGMRVRSTRELAYALLLGSMETGRGNTMYITLDTLKRLPMSSGVQAIMADGQEVSVGIWHQENSSRLVMQLPQTFQRTPRWWPVRWGGGYNPGNYRELDREKPFCHRTVDAVLQKLVSGAAADYRPRWYTVSYVSGAPTLTGMDPWVDISLQGDPTCTFIIPSRSGKPAVGAAGKQQP